MDSPLWQPSRERVERANLTTFRMRMRDRRGEPLRDWPSLYRWSVDEPAAFWGALWDFAGVVAETRGDVVVQDLDRMPGARWFPGARLNFAENLLRRGDAAPALVFRDVSGARSEISFAELRGRVAALARALAGAGVGPGDRVAGFVPNVPGAAIAMLAAATLGAVWTSCSPDFGASGVLDRFGQIEPRVLFAADGYRHGGKTYDVLPRIAAIADRLPSVERVVVIPHLEPEPRIDGIRDAVLQDDFAGAPGGDPPYVRLPFDHPLYVLYSSGTTGKPKCIVHGAGGTLLQHLKEHRLHTDLGPLDRILYLTTCGWMMWNWLVSALASEATVVLYDGSPAHPDIGALWRLVAEERLTVFGTSATGRDASETSHARPRDSVDLSSLRTILSTGSPLAPAGFDHVYQDVKDDVLLASISGGTDIVSCFALGNPVLPVWRGELQGPGLGMAVEILDDDGRSLASGRGHLCCTRPFPSMPVGFWGDPDGARYRAAYFERFPGVWFHGDWAERTPHGGFVIHGRSDATLNPGGVRIGTAEIYRVVERVPEVIESLATAQAWGGDERIVLFVVLRPGVVLDDALRARIRDRLRAEASPRHVPAKIVQVADLPRTRSGKLVELAVRDVIHGRPVANAGAIANPAALEALRDLPELR